MASGHYPKLVTRFTLNIFYYLLIFNVNASLIQVNTYFVRLALQNLINRSHSSLLWISIGITQ